jgi:hypothetical protein
MTEMGQTAGWDGAVIVVAGIVLMLLGCLWAAAEGFSVSRDEYNGLFSAGSFGGGERGAIGSAVFG